MKHCLFIFLILIQFPMRAQMDFHSFEEVIDYADKNAISIKSARIGEQIALAEKKEAGSYLLPYVNASVGYNDNITIQPALVPAQVFNPSASEGELQELAFGTKYLYSSGFQAQWDILNFQKIFAVKTARINEETSQRLTDLNRYYTYNELASTYYSILLSKESIQIYEENTELAETIYESANEKYQNGLISEAELNRAEIKMIQAQSNLGLARSNLDQFYIQLQSQLNTNQEINVLDSPEKFVLKGNYSLKTHPEILWKETEVEKYESLLKQAKAIRLPSISLVYQNFQNWATNDFMGFSDANKLPQQTFGLQINISGLLGFSTSQKIKQSKWQLNLQQQQLENTQLVREREDKLLDLQLQQASDQLAKNEQILKIQQKNDTHSENKYQSGISSLDQRLDRYDDLLAAQDKYLQSLAAFTLAQYKIYIRQIDF